MNPKSQVLYNFNVDMLSEWIEWPIKSCYGSSDTTSSSNFLFNLEMWKLEYNFSKEVGV